MKLSVNDKNRFKFLTLSLMAAEKGTNDNFPILAQRLQRVSLMTTSCPLCLADTTDTNHKCSFQITLILSDSDKTEASISFSFSKSFLFQINMTLNVISPETFYSTSYVYLSTIKILKLFVLL